MNWDALMEQKIPSPYIPEIKTDSDNYNPADEDQQVQSDINAQDAYEQMPESQVQYIKENAEAFAGFWIQRSIIS